MTVCFDIDGTLINYDGSPRQEVIDLFRAFEKLGATMVIWSGGGVDYATRVRDRLGLEAQIHAKGSFKPDLAIDDQSVNLGKINFRVGDGSW